MNPDSLIQLRTILTRLIPDTDDIRRIMADALLDEARVKFASTAVNHWHAVLTVARNTNQMAALLVVVEREYPTNDELLAACAAYRRAVGQSAVTALPLAQQPGMAHYPHAKTALPQPLINHDHAVTLFAQLLQPQPPFRVIRLVGEGNMGKTTLLGKIFPALAAQAGARWAVVDLRNAAQSPLDHLETAGQQLDPALFPGFMAAYEGWLAERLQVSQSDQPWYERRPTTLADPAGAETSAAQPFALLTRKFVEDLRSQSEPLWVLLFDAVDLAHASTQSWLMDELLPRLRPLPQVRVVVAGRRVPPAASSYAALCRDHELRPVVEVEAYIRYCQEIGTTLLEPQIRQLAESSGFTPGTFVGVHQHFIPRERRHG